MNRLDWGNMKLIIFPELILLINKFLTNPHKVQNQSTVVNGLWFGVGTTGYYAVATQQRLDLNITF